MSISFLKYPNTFIFWVMHVIYKKLSFWKYTLKVSYKLSYFVGKGLEFPGYNKKWRSVKFCIFLPFLDIRFLIKHRRNICDHSNFGPVNAIQLQVIIYSIRVQDSTLVNHWITLLNDTDNTIYIEKFLIVIKTNTNR